MAFVIFLFLPLVHFFVLSTGFLVKSPSSVLASLLSSTSSCDILKNSCIFFSLSGAALIHRPHTKWFGNFITTFFLQVPMHCLGFFTRDFAFDLHFLHSFSVPFLGSFPQNWDILISSISISWFWPCNLSLYFSVDFLASSALWSLVFSL